MKLTNPWLDPRISTIRPADAQAYLLRHGWKPKPFPRPQIQVFEGPLADSGEPIILVVPLMEHAQDYVPSLIDLITSLALIEDRLARDIVEEMLPRATSNGSEQERPLGRKKGRRSSKSPR